MTLHGAKMFSLLFATLAHSSSLSHFALELGTRDTDIILINESAKIKVPLPSGTVQKRKIEFILGRYCAKKAMAHFDRDYENCSLSVRKDRSPDWPSGIVGSITHSDRYICAVAAQSADLSGLGVDCEAIIAHETARNIHKHIVQPAEWALYAHSPSRLDLAEFVTLIFSAKESIFKCYFRHIGKHFYFKDASIDGIDFDSGLFSFTFTSDLNETFNKNFHGTGSFTKTQDHIATAVTYKSAPR
ncbi:4'-phosphopantetheinyl transferase family protein [Aliiroseovarius sp. 2305UL8-7]|uniref:4'-phosphopantetheinyl transferase family protein n=1 Tax=Aliiroseovarius conchicola TaxID=3121637 RepID=UPI0035294C83